MRHTSRRLPTGTFYALAAGLLTITACSDATEAPRVTLPVVVDASEFSVVQTDLGYEIAIASAQIALRDLVFTVAGEAHTASLWDTVYAAVVPAAQAHPGHYQGGEVTGELLGEFTIEWPTDDGRHLGDATLIAERYSAANFTFSRGSSEALGEDHALVGHTAIFVGTATKDGNETAFTIVVDSPEDRELVGVPFEATIASDDTRTLGLQLTPLDATEGDTLFDAIDFATLDVDGDGHISIAPDIAAVEDAYNVFRRTFQTHDHYRIAPLP